MVAMSSHSSSKARLRVSAGRSLRPPRDGCEQCNRSVRVRGRARTRGAPGIGVARVGGFVSALLQSWAVQCAAPVSHHAVKNNTVVALR